MVPVRQFNEADAPIKQFPTIISGSDRWSLKSVNELAMKVAKAFRYGTKLIAQTVGGVSPELAQVATTTKLLTALNVPLTLPKFVNETYQAITTSSPKERVARLWESFNAFGTMVQGYSYGIFGLEAVAKLAKLDRIKDWTQSKSENASLLLKLFYPCIIIGHYYESSKYAVAQERLQEIKQNIEHVPHDAEDRVKEAHIRSVCNFVNARNRISAELEYSSEARINQKAQDHISGFDAGVTADKLHSAEAFVNSLASRVRVKSNLETAGIVIKTIQAFTIPFLIFTPSVVAVTAFAAGGAVGRLAHMAVSRVLLPKNPSFAPSTNRSLFEGVTASIQSVTKAIQTRLATVTSYAGSTTKGALTTALPAKVTRLCY